MVYLETLFLWRIRVCGVFVFGLSVHALRLVLYCLFPVVGCRLPCYDAWCMPRSALVAFLAFRCLSTHLCLYYFSFFVTVYLVLKAPPSCRWFSVLLLCIPKQILFRNGDLIRLCLGSGGRCRRKGGMGGKDGLWAGSDAR